MPLSVSDLLDPEKMKSLDDQFKAEEEFKKVDREGKRREKRSDAFKRSSFGKSR